MAAQMGRHRSTAIGAAFCIFLSTLFLSVSDFIFYFSLRRTILLVKRRLKLERVKKQEREGKKDRNAQKN